jgi:CheY-like chemotaxis protein
MPLVDGRESTRLIRLFEAENLSKLSAFASTRAHIPIIAVSATLLESDIDEYRDCGLDGWIMKPINFKNLNQILLGIYDSQRRLEWIYKEGNWERGGWLGGEQS